MPSLPTPDTLRQSVEVSEDKAKTLVGDDGLETEKVVDAAAEEVDEDDDGGIVGGVEGTAEKKKKKEEEEEEEKKVRRCDGRRRQNRRRRQKRTFEKTAHTRTRSRYFHGLLPVSRPDGPTDDPCRKTLRRQTISCGRNSGVSVGAQHIPHIFGRKTQL